MPLRNAQVAAAKAELFKALAHPIRVRVLEVLVEGERPVGELADQLGVELSHLSQQLAVLRRANVVVAERVRTTVYYSLRDPRTAQLLAVARELLAAGLRDTQALLTDLEEAGTDMPRDAQPGSDDAAGPGSPHAGAGADRAAGARQ